MFNELVDPTKVFADHGVEERTLFRSVGVFDGAEGIPKELVVHVTAAIELDFVGKADCGLEIALGQSFRLLGTGLVKVFHVGSVVLSVVELHQVARNYGL